MRSGRKLAPGDIAISISTAGYKVWDNPAGSFIVADVASEQDRMLIVSVDATYAFVLIKGVVGYISIHLLKLADK